MSSGSIIAQLTRLVVYCILNIGLQNFSNQVIASLSCRQCSLKRIVITSLSSTVGYKRAITE